MLAHRPYSRYPLPKPLSSGEGLAAEAADYSSIFVFLDEVCGVQEQTVQVHGQAVQVHGQAAQVPGQAVQVPKQGLNLHRESAFCVAPVAQVSTLKWNLRHLAFSQLPSRCAYIGSRGTYHTDNQRVRVTDGCE